MSRKIITALGYKTHTRIAKAFTVAGAAMILNDIYGVIPISPGKIIFFGVTWGHLIAAGLTYTALLFFYKRYN